MKPRQQVTFLHTSQYAAGRQLRNTCIAVNQHEDVGQGHAVMTCATRPDEPNLPNKQHPARRSDGENIKTDTEPPRAHRPAYSAHRSPIHVHVQPAGRRGASASAHGWRSESPPHEAGTSMRCARTLSPAGNPSLALKLVDRYATRARLLQVALSLAGVPGPEWKTISGLGSWSWILLPSARRWSSMMGGVALKGHRGRGIEGRRRAVANAG